MLWIAGGPIHPLSALLYQSQNINTLSSEDFIRLLRESMVELRQHQPTARYIIQYKMTKMLFTKIPNVSVCLV